MKTTFLFLLLSTLISCDYSDVGEDNHVIYRISPADHQSFPIEATEIVGITKFEFQGMIAAGGRYEFRNADGSLDGDQHDWNKLSGFSDCNNFDAFTGKGAMFTWRWNVELNAIQIGAYVHNQRRPFFFKIFEKTIQQGEWHRFSIEAIGNTYIYTLDDEVIVMEGEEGRGCDGIPITGRLLNPWFGGTKSAPHEVRIELIYQ